MAQEDVFKKLVSHCKEYGFVFPSSDIYDGLGAVYDYGQMGVELKNNIKQYWWQSMVLLHENIVGIDSAIFMHPTIWKASGHVDAFNDPLIDNRDSKKRYRADVLIEDQLAKYDEKINKEVAKAAKRFGDAFDEAQFRSTNGRVLEHQAKRDALHERFSKALNDNDLDELRQIIIDEEIVCPISGTKNWTEVRQFNLMFSTEMGSTADGSMKIYLRPETAQGIFVNYLNVQKTGRMKIPFGIAQIGKAAHQKTIAGGSAEGIHDEDFPFRVALFKVGFGDHRGIQYTGNAGGEADVENVFAVLQECFKIGFKFIGIHLGCFRGSAGGHGGIELIERHGLAEIVRVLGVI